MSRRVIVLPEMSRRELEAVLVDWAESQGATVRPMGRLVRNYKTSGDAMHWHINGDRKGTGTVEVTYLPSTGHLTTLVHDNRRGFWAGEAYAVLGKEIRRLLARRAS